jgi:hypothetical protein
MILTAIQGVGAADQSFEAGKRNQAIARFNANNARVQETQALESGAFAQNVQEVKGEILKGQQQSAAAGGNTVVGAGTNRTVTTGGTAVSEMDRIMLGINAQRQALGFAVKAEGFEMQGDQARIQGNEGALAALIKAGSTELEESDPNYRGKGSAQGARNPGLLSDTGAAQDPNSLWT